MINVYQQISRNRWRTNLIVVLFVAFLALVIWAILGYNNTSQFLYLPAIGLSSLATLGSYWYADRIILAVSRARKPRSLEASVYRQVADNLSTAAGIPLPALYVIDDTAPNAFATGRDPKNSIICVTTGLLEKLNRTELEGVIGHEISHIKHYDTRLMTVVTVLIGSIALLSDWALRLSWGRSDDDRRDSAGVLSVIGLVLIILSPLIGQLIQLALSRRREFYADAGSVMLTRQPSGLISALKKISGDTEILEVANKATANLYIINPFKLGVANRVSRFAALFNTHPPVEQRIEELEKML